MPIPIIVIYDDLLSAIIDLSNWSVSGVIYPAMQQTKIIRNLTDENGFLTTNKNPEKLVR